jgi:hypothetical protein
MDLPINIETGVYSAGRKLETRNEWMDGAEAKTPPASRLECIAGKVVKFMMTTIGSDAYDPNYGSFLPTYRQVAESMIPKLYIEIQNDLVRCTAFIKEIERDLGDTVERLSSVTLVDLIYNPRTTPDRIDVYINIKTTAGNTAVLVVKTGG